MFVIFSSTFSFEIDEKRTPAKIHLGSYLQYFAFEEYCSGDSNDQHSAERKNSSEESNEINQCCGSIVGYNTLNLDPDPGLCFQF